MSGPGIFARVPGQGWLTDGLEVRMRPDRARQLETHTCREGLAYAACTDWGLAVI